VLGEGRTVCGGVDVGAGGVRAWSAIGVLGVLGVGLVDETLGGAGCRLRCCRGSGMSEARWRSDDGGVRGSDGWSRELKFRGRAREMGDVGRLGGGEAEVGDVECRWGGGYAVYGELGAGCFCWCSCGLCRRSGGCREGGRGVLGFRLTIARGGWGCSRGPRDVTGGTFLRIW